MEKNYIYFKSRDELLRVETSSIVYFEADGNYTEIVLANGLKDIVCMNLAKMQKVIIANVKDKAARFVRIGKRFIINMNYVHHIHILQQSIVLSDQKTFSYNLKISKEALKSLKEIMTQTNNK
ncbi:MAG: LytTR family transcriptional regulator DNA-binding domain-containing protein [Bacteroidales bacterium]|nr:LytTR family transcriptional regulator DNA-binding domain-containing protein [Bacteroidales bacterium]